MKKRYVITNIPIRLPFGSTVLYSFLLYHFQASGVLWGIFITLFSILWVIAISMKINEVKIDLSSKDPKEEDKKYYKSKFEERLEQMRNNKNNNN